MYNTQYLYNVPNIYVQYPIFLSDFNGTWIFTTNKKSNIEFHENPPSRTRVIPHGWTDMTQLIVAFHIFRTDLESGLYMS
jgi:hypothetical protein